jgi:hypothetical protein
MARSSATKTAARKTAARPARKRASRAAPAAGPEDKAAEATLSHAAEHALAEAHPHGLEAFGAAIGGFLKSLGGLQLPQTRMSELQDQYVNQATALWNGAIDQIPVPPVDGATAPAAAPVPKPIGDRPGAGGGRR